MALYKINDQQITFYPNQQQFGLGVIFTGVSLFLAGVGLYQVLRGKLDSMYLMLGLAVLALVVAMAFLIGGSCRIVIDGIDQTVMRRSWLGTVKLADLADIEGVKFVAMVSGGKTTKYGSYRLAFRANPHAMGIRLGYNRPAVTEEALPFVLKLLEKAPARNQLPLQWFDVKRHFRERDGTFTLAMAPYRIVLWILLAGVLLLGLARLLYLQGYSENVYLTLGTLAAVIFFFLTPVAAFAVSEKVVLDTKTRTLTSSKGGLRKRGVPFSAITGFSTMEQYGRFGYYGSIIYADMDGPAGKARLPLLLSKGDQRIAEVIAGLEHIIGLAPEAPARVTPVPGVSRQQTLAELQPHPERLRQAPPSVSLHVVICGLALFFSLYTLINLPDLIRDTRIGSDYRGNGKLTVSGSCDKGLVWLRDCQLTVRGPQSKREEKIAFFDFSGQTKYSARGIQAENQATDQAGNQLGISLAQEKLFNRWVFVVVPNLIVFLIVFALIWHYRYQRRKWRNIIQDNVAVAPKAR